MLRYLIFLFLFSHIIYSQNKPSWTVESNNETDKVRIIIRGDDIGVTHASNMAMLKGFENGILTSASVMSGAPWFTETASIIRAHPEWCIGLHLTLSNGWNMLNWPPLASSTQVPSLVADDGNLYHSFPDYPLALKYLKKPPYLYGDDLLMPETMLERRRSLTATTLPNIDEVEVELRAQIDRARKMGVRIDYLDCHMGVACDPQLISVMIKLAEEYCIPIPEENFMGTEDIWIPSGKDLDERINKFIKMLDSLNPGTYRLVLHPTEDTEEVRASDSYFGVKGAISGERNLNFLLNERLKLAIKRNNIELISIKDLWDKKKCQIKSSIN